MKKVTKIKNAIKRKVNESRLRDKVSSILDDALPNILAELDQLDQAFLDAKPVKEDEDLEELDVRKTHGDRRIENPKTGNDIKLRTALKAKKGSAVYQQARQIYNSLKDEPANEQVAAQLKELKELLDMNERAYASTDGKPYFDYDPGQGKLTEALNAPKKFTVKKKIRVDGNIYNPGTYILKKKKAGGGIYLNTSNGEMLGAYTGTIQASDSGFFVEGKLNEATTMSADDILKLSLIHI